MQPTTHPRWRSQTNFIYAGASAAIGLGNIWRFPYLTGQHGGSAFVCLYIFFVIVLGLPLMLSEMLIGRIGRKNPVHSVAAVAKLNQLSPKWKWMGAWLVLTGFIISSYYVVISGWVLSYTWQALAGHLNQLNAKSASMLFTHLSTSWSDVIISTTSVLIATAYILSKQLHQGLEKAIRFLFPLFILLMIILIIYAASFGAFSKALHYLFRPDIQKLNWHTCLIALGQAFFSLGIALGGIVIMYSAYLPDQIKLPSSAIIITAADTLIAILAGLIVFPIVFAFHLSPSSGAGLIFNSLPLAFSHVHYAHLFASLFFVLLFFAAFTSILGLVELLLVWLQQQFSLSRKQSSWLSCFVLWLASWATILSFCAPKLANLFHHSWFYWIDTISGAWMLPIGGLALAIFTGWRIKTICLTQKLHWHTKHWAFKAWRFSLRYLAPVGIGLVLWLS